MFLTDGPAAGRRSGWMGLGLMLGVLSSAPAYAQAPPAQAQPVAAVRLYPNDGAMVLNFIKPDKVADFEEVMAKLKEALMKSDKPERKEQAKGWKIFKSPDPAGANVLYVFVIDPSVKTADYQISNIIAEAFPVAEANVIRQKYADAFAQGINIINLSLFQKLGE